jgi:pyruvate,water dikinase
VKKLGGNLRRIIGGKKISASSNFRELQTKFNEFKYLLRANNEALTIIAEVEARLKKGGGGVEFLSSRYIAASAKVYKMIRHLNQISGNRYAALLPSFNLIRHNIDDILSSVGAGATGDRELVLPLFTVKRDQGYLVGAKAGNLAQSWGIGCSVCDGFVITTAVFRRFMQYTGLDGQLRQAVMLLEDFSYPKLLQVSRPLQEKIYKASLPAEIEVVINEAVKKLYDRQGGVIRLSLRSSAIGEDSEVSFAGQYTSRLGVEYQNVLDAYREVVASLYSPQAIIYRRKNSMRDEDAEMAVLVQGMLAPTVSGVMYTRDPLLGDKGPLLISAVYGLGLGGVDGSITPDIFTVSRQAGLRLINTQLGAKATRIVDGSNGNYREEVPAELAGRPALTPEQIIFLARLGISLEEKFGRSQDVEWALAEDDRFFVLQSRPLPLLATVASVHQKRSLDVESLLVGGQTACPGVGAGMAYLVRNEQDLIDFPDGAVLVAHQSSPTFAAVLPRAAAVITAVGGVTGHMASLTREFGVPALVGATMATKVIAHGQEVTLDADGHRVYSGRIKEILREHATPAARLERVERFTPGWYHAADLITSLTFTNPRSPDFIPERCKTFHDIIRFVHEKVFKEMFSLGERLEQVATSQLRQVAYRLPFELWVIDLGGGIGDHAGKRVVIEDFTSAPGRALMEGLLDQRMVWDQPRPINFKGLVSVFSSAMLDSPRNNDSTIRAIGEKAYAIVSADYLNFNSRVGYHFAALDCFCGQNQNDNYISFRFSGGAATEERRTLRAELIGHILAEFGYEISQTGDAVNAFLKKHEEQATLERVRDLGRLILFTRQMDMLTSDKRMVAWLADAFLNGNYKLEAR